jgi:hypothetical protein
MFQQSFVLPVEPIHARATCSCLLQSSASFHFSRPIRARAPCSCLLHCSWDEPRARLHVAVVRPLSTDLFFMNENSGGEAPLGLYTNE